MKASDIYDQIFAFFDSCKNVYVYGNGHYGKAVLHLLENGVRMASGVIVSTEDVSEEGVYAFSYIEKELNPNDGIIFAMSQKNVASLNKRKKGLSKCLFLKDWQLDEICKLDYYQASGYMPNVNGLVYHYRNIESRVCRFLRRMSLHNKNIEPWHMISKREKPYCEEIVHYILGTRAEGLIVELGCGLCDIIGDRRLKRYERTGLDIDESVVDEARLHYRDIDLRQGSFDEIGENNKISFLITINFLHAIPPDELRNHLERVFASNRVDYYIVDEVTGNYKYSYKLEEVLPPEYNLDNIIGIHPSDGGVRTVKVFSKIEK